MQQNNILIFIESSGKIDTVKKIFNDLNIKNITIYPTKGRIKDLSKDKLSINIDNFNEFKRESISERKIKEIEDNIKKSETILLLTDNDIEGEMIAYDLKKMAKDKKCYRLRVQEITQNQVLKALKNLDTIDNKMVLNGCTRRIFDRYIGYSYNCDKENHSDVINIGRVLTPSLVALKQEEHSEKTWISYNCVQNNEEWSVNFPIAKKSQFSGEDVFEIIKELPKPTISKISEKIFEDDTIIWTSQLALEKITHALNAPVLDVSKSLQRLYEKGKLSYPRTDSTKLEQHSCETLNLLAQKYRINNFNIDFFKNEIRENNFYNGHSQNGHTALIPLVNDIDFLAPLKNLTLDDQVLSLLTRNLLRRGQQNRKIKISEGKIINFSSEWEDLIKMTKIQPLIFNKTSFIENSSKITILNDNVMPLGSIIGTSIINGHILRTKANDLIALSVMNKYNIGRPSTLGLHASKIAKNFMSKTGQINKRAEKAILDAMRNTPGLTKIKNFNKIEKIFYSGNGDINQRVKDAIRIANQSSKVKNTVNTDYESSFDF